MQKLSPAMERMVRALNAYGYVDCIRDGRRTGTVVALMRRGILREATPAGHALGSGRHYPATERTDALHSQAWIDHMQWNRERGAFQNMTQETWEWFVNRMREEWGLIPTQAQAHEANVRQGAACFAAECDKHGHACV